MQYQTALDDYNRLVPVYEAGGISAQQLEQTKAALDVQKEVLDNLKKNIEMRSPIAGVVTARRTTKRATCSRGRRCCTSCRSIR